METKYSVMFTGELCSDFNFEEVLSNFIALTKMEAEKAKKFLSSTKPVLIRKDVDRETAEKYQSGLTKAGLHIELLGSEAPPAASAAAVAPVPAYQTSSAPAQTAENPYAAPKADLKVEKKDEFGAWLDEPQKVPAFNGGYWIKSATALFLAEPWRWVGMFLVAMLITIPINFLPFVGGLINTFLGILFAGGIIMGAHELAEGGDLTFGYLFKGFKQNRNQLILVGVIYLAFFILVGFVAALILGGSLGLFGMAGGNPGGIAMAMQNNMGLFWIIVLVGLGILTLFMMAYWFTTPLVALADRNALASYKLSFRGCLKNWTAFLIYGLVFLAIIISLMVGYMLVSGVLSGLTSGNTMFIGMMLIMALIGLPITIIGALSVYTGFREIFYRSA
ncbi:MAG: hypothetical protein JXK94_13020 [Deltaproteobacteria bacterium]|nr:hypothetical protein [Deltaproteobacteria bacterium]